MENVPVPSERAEVYASSLCGDAFSVAEEADESFSFYCLVPDLPYQDVYNDAQNRTRRASLSGRLQRQVHSHDTLFPLAYIRKNVALYKESLIHTFAQCYSSCPNFNCPVASEHYVYGLRRILI